MLILHTMDEKERIAFGFHYIVVDWGCKHNPWGKWYYQWYLVSPKGEKLLLFKQQYPQSTNNMMEYMALMHAIVLRSALKDMGHTKFYNAPIFSDSKIAIGRAFKRQHNIKSNFKDRKVYREFDDMERRARDKSRLGITLRQTKLRGENPADFWNKKPAKATTNNKPTLQELIKDRLDSN